MRSNGCCVGEVRMEVPLAWQDPVPLTRFSVMEADTDDIPPSPTPDPVTPPFGAGTFFQRGFLDCAHEAIRFLTEEEGMSENNPVVMGLQQHLVKATPSFPPPSSSPCLSSSQSQRGRFTPYTVPSHRNVASGCARREGDKRSSSQSSRGSLHPRYSAHIAPSTHKMDHVLASDLISTDDLQGVLRCLESEHSHALQTLHQCSSLSHSPSPSSLSVLQHVPTEVKSCETDEGKKDWQSRSLDDSGISEVDSAGLADEVDGVDAQCTSVCDLVYDVDAAANTDSASDRVRDSGDDSPPHDRDTSCVGGGSCPTADRLAHNENLLQKTMSSLNSCHHSPSGSSTPSVSESHSASSPSTVPTTATADTVDSNPSSQLALLSSLSSGTHRLTSASSDNGDPTASRIQSLASQILLLLQEEADAQDSSDDDEIDEEDDHTSDIGESEVELEEDFLDLEAEP